MTLQHRIKFNFLQLSLLLGLAFLTSCGGEDEPIITPPAPTVTISQGDGVTLNVGETLTLNATAAGEGTIVQAIVYRNQTIISDTPLTGGFTNFQFPVFNYPITEEDAGQNITFTFEARDGNGKSGEASFLLTVLEPPMETPLAYESTGSILGNRIGPDFSAWNLVDNLREGKDATTSDMQNPSIATGTVEQQWIKGWDGENGTVFVKSNGYDYSNATVESASAAFAEGTSTSQIRAIAIGDIYIAKLRGQEVYSPILITNVSENLEGNNEEIIFSYKKVTETAGQ